MPLSPQAAADSATFFPARPKPVMCTVGTAGPPACDVHDLLLPGDFATPGGTMPTKEGNVAILDLGKETSRWCVGSWSAGSLSLKAQQRGPRAPVWEKVGPPVRGPQPCPVVIRK